MSNNTQIWKNSVAGWVAGICNVAIAMPFDTCKVRIQTSNSTCFLTTLVSIVKMEKASALWKGCLFPFITSGLCTSFVFTSYTKLKTLFCQSEVKLTKYSLEQYISGGLAGAAGAFLFCPIEHIRIKMQMKGSTAQYKNSYDCLRQLASRNGIKGLYRGLSITVLRDFFWMANYFFTFEKLKEYNTSKNKILIFMSGGLAGVAGWTGGFILDNIKSKLQADSLEEPRYRSVRQIFAEFTWKQLRTGYSVGIYRSIIVSATTLGVFQIMCDTLSSTNF